MWQAFASSRVWGGPCTADQDVIKNGDNMLTVGLCCNMLCLLFVRAAMIVVKASSYDVQQLTTAGPARVLAAGLLR